jgi:hypothetical protein
MIHTTSTDAAESRVCIFDLQVFGVSKGILCEQPTQQSVVDTACEAFEPILYSQKLDRPELVKKIREHNAAWDALCKLQ